ncbi:hypothetical protein [Bartonella sp. DGB2]|uniref:hypothetical protein n=1 Tax=Bartonella sp. DGB2 TaxID=3388426 RepID=UPI00398FD47C
MTIDKLLLVFWSVLLAWLSLAFLGTTHILSHILPSEWLNQRAVDILFVGVSLIFAALLFKLVHRPLTRKWRLLAAIPLCLFALFWIL